MDELYKELQLYSFKNNYNRQNVGIGISLPFGKQIASRRAKTECLNNSKYPRIYQLLVDYGNKHVPIFWTSIMVNKNYECNPHKDSKNIGSSYIIGFGNYTGGELNIEGVKYNINNKPLIFNGSEKLHWVEPFVGTRYTVIYFNQFQQ